MNNRSKKITLITEDTLISGVDVAKKKHWARIWSPRGEDLIKPLDFENSRDGFLRLGAKAKAVLEQTGAKHLMIGMEPTGHYWKPLAQFLLEQGFTVVLVNPHHVKKSKELDDNSPTKSDRKDAGVIAHLVKEGRWLHCLLPQGVYAELRVLFGTRQQQKRRLNGCMNQLEAILDEYFPEFGQVFKGYLGKAAQWALALCPFPRNVLEMGVERIAAGFAEASSGRVGRKRAQSLWAAAQESIGVKVGLEGARLKLGSCLREITFLKGELAQTEAAMEEALQGTGLAEYLLSIPGVGVVTAAGFLGEIGDPDRYENWRQIQKLAGLNLTEQSSGQKRGQRSISKRGRPMLRSLLYQAALVAVAKNAVFQALYHHFLSRTDNPLKKKQALVAVSLKLLRVMFTLVKTRQAYDATKVLGAYRTQQFQVAA